LKPTFGGANEDWLWGLIENGSKVFKCPDRAFEAGAVGFGAIFEGLCIKFD